MYTHCLQYEFLLNQPPIFLFLLCPLHFIPLTGSGQWAWAEHFRNLVGFMEKPGKTSGVSLEFGKVLQNPENHDIDCLESARILRNSQVFLGNQQNFQKSPIES